MKCKRTRAPGPTKGVLVVLMGSFKKSTLLLNNWSPKYRQISPGSWNVAQHGCHLFLCSSVQLFNNLSMKLLNEDLILGMILENFGLVSIFYKRAAYFWSDKTLFTAYAKHGQLCLIAGKSDTVRYPTIRGIMPAWIVIMVWWWW